MRKLGRKGAHVPAISGGRPGSLRTSIHLALVANGMRSESFSVLMSRHMPADFGEISFARAHFVNQLTSEDHHDSIG
jgi:hypothetical protein